MWNYGSAPHWAPDGRCYYNDDGQTVRTSSDNVSEISRSNSSPPKFDRIPMSTRFTTGYLSARFGSLGSRGSAPAEPASTLDPYRQAMDSKSKPPSDSPFAQASRSYKRLDNSALVAKGQYKARLETAQKVTLKMKTNSPGVFCGQPRETMAWHQATAVFARRAADSFRAAAEAREQMARDYPGYDKHDSARGHSERIQRLKSDEEKLEKKYAAHIHSHD